MAGRITLARKLAAVLAVAGLAGGLLAGAPAAPALAAHRAAIPRVPEVKPAAGVGILRPRHTRQHSVAMYRPTAVAWPSAARATVKLSAAAPRDLGNAAPARGQAGPVRYAPGTPVWAQWAAAPAHPVTAIRVHVLSHAAALAMGVRGVVFTAAPAAGSGGETSPPGAQLRPVRPGVWRELRPGTGPGGTARMRADQAHAGRVPVSKTAASGERDGQPERVSTGHARQPQRRRWCWPRHRCWYDGGGPAGSYTATSLQASGSWTEGGSSGSFTYSYPISVPPGGRRPGARGRPGLRLGQRGRADRRDPGAGVLGRRRLVDAAAPTSSSRSCPAPTTRRGSAAPQSTQDECYDGPILTLSLDGTSTSLVCPIAVQLHHDEHLRSRPMTTARWSRTSPNSGNGTGT